jgi:hypothetical protein
MGDGTAAMRAAAFAGATFASSWQPMQETASPGMAVNQLLMSATAFPSESRGCTAIGVFAGTVK